MSEKLKISMQIILSEKFKVALEQIAKHNMPIRAAIAIARNINTINAKLEDYNKSRLQLINDLAVKDDSGKLVANPDGTAKFDANNLNEFTKRLSEILNEDAELEGISAEEFGSLLISPEQVSLLLPIIK